MEDDAAVRNALSFYLVAANFSSRPFACSQTFVAELDTLQPGCVLLDIRMPNLDGFGVLAELASRRAQLPAVMMTGHGDVVTAVRAMRLGASDFLEKPFEEDELLEILQRVFAELGDTVREFTRKREACARLGNLSSREQEVLRGLLAGHSNKVLAYELGISIRTVEMHRAGMMERLGVRTLAEALRLAFDGERAMPPVNAPSAQHSAAAH